MSKLATAHEDPVPIRTGRPPTTSRDEVARVGLRMFARHGFEQTSLEEIAAEVGVSRRTILRYYASKNDIVWGAFDEHLAGLHDRLAAMHASTPLMEAIREAVIAFNDYGADELPDLRRRMTLIATVPALQGHAMLRYGDWCSVIAEFAAARLGAGPRDHLPQVIANAALGTAMATYRYWIDHPQSDLLAALDRAFRALAAGFVV